MIRRGSLLLVILVGGPIVAWAAQTLPTEPAPEPPLPAAGRRAAESPHAAASPEPAPLWHGTPGGDMTLTGPPMEAGAVETAAAMGEACPSCSNPGVLGFFRHHQPCQSVPDPRVDQSWLEHPFSFGLFAGYLDGSTLVDDWVDQREGYLGGFRFGWDIDDYWGLEARYAFGSCVLSDSPRAIAARDALDAMRNVALYDPNHRLNARDRLSDRTYWDVTFSWYPLGNRRWRPYVMTGIGLAQFRFDDLLFAHYADTLVDIPLALGVKYRATERLAVRFEVCDSLVFGSNQGFNTLHDLSATASLELRFGGPRRSYWPWNPGSYAW